MVSKVFSYSYDSVIFFYYFFDWNLHHINLNCSDRSLSEKRVHGSVVEN